MGLEMKSMMIYPSASQSQSQSQLLSLFHGIKSHHQHQSEDMAAQSQHHMVGNDNDADETDMDHTDADADEREKIQGFSSCESEINALKRRALMRRNRQLRDSHSYVCDLLANLLEELEAREKAFKCAMEQKSEEWKAKEQAYQNQIKSLERAAAAALVMADNNKEAGVDALSTMSPSSKYSKSGAYTSKFKEIKRKSKMRETAPDMKHVHVSSVSSKSKLCYMSKSLVGRAPRKENLYSQSRASLSKSLVGGPPKQNSYFLSHNKPRADSSCVEQFQLKKNILAQYNSCVAPSGQPCATYDNQ